MKVIDDKDTKGAYNVLTSNSAHGLQTKVLEYTNEGWCTLGSMNVVEVHHQLRYAGMQHKDTVIEREYSQVVTH